MLADYTVDVNALAWPGAIVLGAIILVTIWRGIRIVVEVTHRDRSDDDGV